MALHSVNEALGAYLVKINCLIPQLPFVMQENVETLIAAYQEQGRKQLQCVEEKCEEPSPR